MDDLKFPELEETSDLELLRTRKDLVELKAKLAQYEAILSENDLLEDAPKLISDTEIICTRELARYNELSQKGAGLTLEDVKIVDLLTKNLLLAQGKAPVVVEKKTKKEDKQDLATLLKIAETKGG
jgi:16S rRNA C1402 (ribose-2'-O) methylase RsmI